MKKPTTTTTTKSAIEKQLQKLFPQNEFIELTGVSRVSYRFRMKGEDIFPDYFEIGIYDPFKSKRSFRQVVQEVFRVAYGQGKRFGRSCMQSDFRQLLNIPDPE